MCWLTAEVVARGILFFAKLHDILSLFRVVVGLCFSSPIHWIVHLLLAYHGGKMLSITLNESFLC
jgi:hypothetical protein